MLKVKKLLKYSGILYIMMVNLSFAQEDTLLHDKKKFNKHKEQHKVKNIFKDFEVKDSSKVFEDDDKLVYSITLARDRENENKAPKEDSLAKRFFDKYLFSLQNQVFLNKHNLISVYAGYDMTASHSSRILSDTKEYQDITIIPYEDNIDVKRDSANFAISYALPTKLWGIHGRWSFSIFSFLIRQNIKSDRFNPRAEMVESDGYEYNAEIGDLVHPLVETTVYDTVNGYLKQQILGGEMSEELIFGHPNLYITFGFGISYIFAIKSWSDTNTDNYDKHFKELNPQIMWNNSRFNWVVKASLGHRFDFGMIVEINWKHYSNGAIYSPNWGFNHLGITIGYAF